MYPDFKELLSVLNAYNVKYLVVGAYAVSIHAQAPSEAKAAGSTPSKALITVPASAVKGNSVYLVVDGKALRRSVTVAGTTSQGVQIDSGLIGGEDLISNPPPDLKDGQKVHPNPHA